MTKTNLSLMDKEAVEAEIKRLRDDLEKYKQAWRKVPDEFFWWEHSYPVTKTGELLVSTGLTCHARKKTDIARECGLEVEYGPIDCRHRSDV